MKESGIQTTIETNPKYLENQKKLAYIKNNSGAYQTKRGSFVRFGKAGSADFLVFLPDGKTLHLEVKTPKGRQSENQKEYQKRVESLGHTYKIITSVNQLSNILELSHE